MNEIQQNFCSFTQKPFESDVHKNVPSLNFLLFCSRNEFVLQINGIFCYESTQNISYFC